MKVGTVIRQLNVHCLFTGQGSLIAGLVYIYKVFEICGAEIEAKSHFLLLHR